MATSALPCPLSAPCPLGDGLPAAPPACPCRDRGGGDPGDSGGVDWVGALQPPPRRPAGWLDPPERLAVTAEVYAASRTGSGGPASGLRAELVLMGAGTCRSIPMGYDGPAGPRGHNDRFRAEIPLRGLGRGVFRYRVRAGFGGGWRWSEESPLLVDPLTAIGDALSQLPARAEASPARDRLLLDLDACLLTDYLTGPGGLLEARVFDGPVRSFVVGRLTAAAERLDLPSPRAEVLMLYNAGLVYRTPRRTLGIDVVVPDGRGEHALPWKPEPSLVERLASRLDGLLISHAHSDHADLSLIEAMAARGRPVLGPPSLATAIAGVTPIRGGARMLGEVRVEAFSGPHAYDDALGRRTDHLHFRIEPPGAPVLLHTGDLDHTVGLEAGAGPVDILAAKAGGVSPRYDDQIPGARGGDREAFLLAVRAVGPRLALPLHLMELTHPEGGGRESYAMALGFRDAVEREGCRYAVMAPGDWLEVAGFAS